MHQPWNHGIHYVLWFEINNFLAFKLYYHRSKEILLVSILSAPIMGNKQKHFSLMRISMDCDSVDLRINQIFQWLYFSFFFISPNSFDVTVDRHTFSNIWMRSLYLWKRKNANEIDVSRTYYLWREIFVKKFTP